MAKMAVYLANYHGQRQYRHVGGHLRKVYLVSS